MMSVRVYFPAAIQDDVERFKRAPPCHMDGRERLIFCGLAVQECHDGYFYEYHSEPSFLRLPEAARWHMSFCTMQFCPPLSPLRTRGIYRHPEHHDVTARLDRNSSSHVFVGKGPSLEALCQLADLILAGAIVPEVSHEGPQLTPAPASEPWRDELRRLAGRLDAVEAEVRAVRHGTFTGRLRTEAVALRDRARTAATEAVAYAHAALLEGVLGGISRRTRP